MGGKLSYLLIEYEPYSMSNRNKVSARMDGHYSERKMAEEVAELWREEAISPNTRIVVAEIVTDIKQPDHWRVK